MVLTILLVVVWVLNFTFTVKIWQELKHLRMIEDWMVGKGDDLP